MPPAKAKPENDAQTVYTVQQLQALVLAPADLDTTGPRELEAWVDLGEYTAINNRKAIEDAMADKDIEEGDFRAIPATSSKIFKPRVDKRTVWT